MEECRVPPVLSCADTDLGCSPQRLWLCLSVAVKCVCMQG